MSADPRARWAEQIAVPVDATPDEVAAGFLRVMPGDLLPPAEFVLAASALTGIDLPTGRDDNREAVLAAELEAFAAQFWSLLPADRLLGWDELSRRGANPLRLRELEPGLDVTAPTIVDPLAEELAEQFRVLFVLPPRDRAIRRAEWVLARAGDIGRWRSALAVVQRDAPALVALEPRFRTFLELMFDPAALAAGVNRMSVSVDVADFSRRLARSARADDYDDEAAYEAADGARARNIFLGSPVIFLLLFGCCALSGFVRHAARDSGNKPSTYVPSFPREYSAPKYLPPDNVTEPPSQIFSGLDVYEFQQYERDTAAGRSVPEPRGYSLWRQQGRPAGRANPWVTAPPDAFTPADVAACEFYESERSLGRSAIRPLIYDRWLNAGRPRAPTAAREPGPNEVRVHLDSFLIAACQRHDRTGTARPFRYADWVAAGKPSAPGDYVIPRQPTAP